MDNDFKLKAYLFEKGIKVSKEAKEILDKQSDIWLMDDYITCSGLTLHYNNCYVTAGSDDNSDIELMQQLLVILILGLN